MIFSIKLLFLLTSFFVNCNSLQDFDDYKLENNSTCDISYQYQLVKMINKNRAIHKSPPLALDGSNAKIVLYAQEKADFNAGKQHFPPFQPSISFGEFDTVYTYDWTDPKTLINNLYHKGDNYPYYGREPPNDEAINRYSIFTQMVWAKSRRVTFGCTDSGTYTRHLVAVFIPPGNVRREFASNVLPPSDQY